MGSFLSTSQSETEWKSEAQFAMESSYFCVVCGSPFDLSGDLYNLDTEAARYKVSLALQNTWQWLTVLSGCGAIALLVAAMTFTTTICQVYQKTTSST